MEEKDQVVEDKTPEEQGESDWREAFDHASKAAREAFNAAAEATSEILRQGGKLAEQTITEAHRTFFVTLDSQATEAVEKMVSAGIHKNRAEAIRQLINQGIKASGDVLARIDKVEAQIEELRSKMREIPIESE
jgi:Arc/MetJ-type ribon-helix-helix transcriptional regulator